MFCGAKKKKGDACGGVGVASVRTHECIRAGAIVVRGTRVEVSCLHIGASAVLAHSRLASHLTAEGVHPIEEPARTRARGIAERQQCSGARAPHAVVLERSKARHKRVKIIRVLGWAADDGIPTRPRRWCPATRPAVGLMIDSGDVVAIQSRSRPPHLTIESRLFTDQQLFSPAPL